MLQGNIEWQFINWMYIWGRFNGSDAEYHLGKLKLEFDAP